MWTSTFVAIFVTLGVFVRLFTMYESIRAKTPTARGKPTLTITLLTRTPTIAENKIDAVLLFDAEDSLSAIELREIALDILAVTENGDSFGNTEVSELIGWMAKRTQRPGRRHPVPGVIARGKNLLLVNTVLLPNYLHPSWKTDRVVICRISGGRTGNVSQLPWNTPEAQQFHAPSTDFPTKYNPSLNSSFALS